MRTTEGVGRVPPKPVTVDVGKEGLAWANRLTDERMEQRQYHLAKTRWAYSAMGDPRGSVLIGFMGGIAFSHWASEILGRPVPVDTQFRRGGDGGVDFTIGPHRIQMKTAQSEYPELLVKSDHVAVAEWNVIVRGQWTPEEIPVAGPTLFEAGPRVENTVVELCGWMRVNDFLRHGRLEKARRGDHWNYEVGPVHFQPMSAFEDLLIARRELGGAA